MVREDTKKYYICKELQCLDALKSLKIVIDLLNAFSSFSVEVGDEAYRKFQGLVCYFEKEIIGIGTTLLERSMAPNESLEFLCRTVIDLNYTKDCIHFINLAKN